MRKNPILCLLVLFLIFVSNLKADTSSPSYNEDIRNTKHNLSVTRRPDLVGPKSDTEDQLCVFCHTPHGAEGIGPIWNKNFTNAQYTTYKPQISFNTNITKIDSGATGSLDSIIPDTPSGYSKLCLSCHDGTIAFSDVLNSSGTGRGSGIGGIAGIFIPAGDKGEFSGDTRRLGLNLSNDHPISFVFDDKVSKADKELKIPSYNNEEWKDISRVRLYPLDFNSSEKNAVQCTSCHNPHTTTEKFLRESRYDTKPAGESDQICYSCHPKAGWFNSTHELNNSPFDGTQLNYRTDTGFPETDGKTVGEHGCLNCHDPHTAQGADRLHRNGASSFDGNGTPAIENTCYQCHISNIEQIPLVGGTKFVNQAPDIKSHFDKRDLPGNNGASTGSAMPLTKNWSNLSTNGIHQPEFVSNDTVGKEAVLFNPEDSSNVHVECVDCHNPHQVNSKNRVRGMKGITIKGEEIGGDITVLPFDDRSPVGQSNVAIPDNAVDRLSQGYDPLIYEICLRCHGDTFGRVMPFIAKGADTGTMNDSDTNVRLAAVANAVARERHRGHTTTGGGLFGAAEIFGASNKRREFDPDSPSQTRHLYDAGKTTYATYNTAYHPVAAPGRNGTLALFNQLKKSFDLSSQEELKTLTMMCTDCHNNDSFNGDAAVYVNGKKGPVTGLNNGSSYRRTTDRASGLDPSIERDPGYAQGPHGSKNQRILRGNYDSRVHNTIPERPNISSIKQKFALCFICHEADVILGERNTGDNTNFGSNTGETWGGNLHRYHLRLAGAACHECHNNVHSNVEADNTIFGDGNGNLLHPDGDDSHPGDGIKDNINGTHLLNFGPQASGTTYNYPNWRYEGGEFRCYLRCHGPSMDQCRYTHVSGKNENMWCAGWQ